MTSYTRKRVKENPERQILLGMIVSDKFIRDVQPILKTDLIETPFILTVIGWCQEYYKQFETAPGIHIEDIYKKQVRAGNLEDDQEQLIADLLLSLNSEYERAEQFNSAYILDQTEKYFEGRNLANRVAGIKLSLSRNDVVAAQKEILEYKRVALPQSNGIDPFTDRDGMRKAFEAAGQPLFRLPGAVGKFLNDLFTPGAFVTLLGPEKRGKCLDKDTPILLPDGRVKSIEQVVIDKDPEIMSLNEKTMKLESKRISDYWDNGEKECCKVITRTGREIITTWNHPYLTPTGWKDVKDIQIGERIAVPCNLPCFGNSSMEEHKIKLLAFLIAEGGLYKSSDVRFCSTHLDIQADFIDCVNKMGDRVSDSVSNSKDFSIINHSSCERKHGSNKTSNWLSDLGLMGKRSKDKFIPDCVFSLPRKQLKLFLNILFSCDGSVGNGGVEYSSASKKMIQQIYHLLLRFGIVGNIRVKVVKETEYWILSLRDRNSLLKFINRIGFSFYKKELAEKERKIQLQKKRSNCFLTSVPPELIEKIHQEVDGKIPKEFQEVIRTAIKNRTNTSNNVVRRMASFSKIASTISFGDIMWDAVVEKVDVGKRHTYDLSVPDFHNFVAADIIAHNTWLLIELSIHARRAGLNVAFFSAGDMTTEQLQLRYGIRFTGRSHKPKYCGELKVPILDCWYNQDDSCDCSERKGIWGVVKDKEKKELLPFEEAKDHVVCTHCLKNKEEGYTYKGSSWFAVRPPVKPLDWLDAIKAGERLNKRWGKKSKMRLCSYPNESFTMDEMRHQLNLWEDEDGFVPDVIITDYMDLIVPNTDRMMINKAWASMRGLSQEKHALVISASQSDAESQYIKWLGYKNFSEDKRKFSHVTGTITLNQLPEEKIRRVMRLGQLAVREDDFDQKNYVTILQSLAQGKAIIDSY